MQCRDERGQTHMKPDGRTGNNTGDPPGAQPEKTEKDLKKEKRRRVLSRFAKILTGFVVVSVTATETMMFILFGRSDRQSDAPFGLTDWAASRGYSMRVIEFESCGNTLKGYIASPAHPRAMMLVVHGVRSSSDAMDGVVRCFLEKDYAVMCFDGTASGRSGGSGTVGLQQQRYDVRAALEVLKGVPSLARLPLILFGHSAGAYGVAAESGTPNVRAVVCVSGFDSPLKTMRYWAEHYAGALSNVEYPFLWLREFIKKGSEATASAAQALRESGVPALVVHGSGDDVIPMEVSLYQAVQSAPLPNVQLIRVDGEGRRGHTDILVSDRAGDNDALLSHIAAFLRPYITD